MSTDLKYLAFTAILTASLWIPYVVDPLVLERYPAPAKALQGVVARLD